MKSDATTISDYLQELPEDRHQALATLRQLIRDAVPEAKELMKYGHPHDELAGPFFALAPEVRQI